MELKDLAGQAFKSLFDIEIIIEEITGEKNVKFTTNNGPILEVVQFTTETGREIKAC